VPRLSLTSAELVRAEVAYMDMRMYAAVGSADHCEWLGLNEGCEDELVDRPFGPTGIPPSSILTLAMDNAFPLEP
jgi:hypothetical protein